MNALENVFFIAKTRENGTRIYLEYPFSRETYELIRKTYLNDDVMIELEQEPLLKSRYVKYLFFPKDPDDISPLDFMVSNKRFITYPILISQKLYKEEKDKQWLRNIKEEGGDIITFTNNTIEDKQDNSQILLENFNFVYQLDKAKSLEKKNKDLIDAIRKKIISTTKEKEFKEYLMHSVGREIKKIELCYNELFTPKSDLTFEKFIEKVRRFKIYRNLEDLYNKPYEYEKSNE